MRAMESGDPKWRDKVDAWLAEVIESYRIGFQNVHQEWLQWRQQLHRAEPSGRGTIEILCNNPFGEEWTVIELQWTNPYHPEILCEEVQSWLKRACGNEVRKEDVRYWHIWDEEWQVDGSQEREPRDGERYAILRRAEGEDIEQRAMPGHPRSRVQDFVKRTRWRRLKSRMRSIFGKI
jgi:hypothetical protein